MEMIALQAGKCAAVSRTLCGRGATHVRNPPVEARDGRGEERACTRSACKYNALLSLLSCECNRALLGFSSSDSCLLSVKPLPTQGPGKAPILHLPSQSRPHSSTVEPETGGNFLFLFTFSLLSPLFILPGLSSYQCAD